MKRTRRTIQFAFVLLTLVGVFAVRGNAERWCPFGGVEALYGYIREGSMLCSLGVSNFFILGGVLLSVVLLKRAFCGFVCPIGAISEGTHWVGKKLGIKRVRVTGPIDRVLAFIKYPVLVLILWLTWRTAELMFRGFDPCYALLSRHGEDITFWAYVVAGSILVGSLLIITPFCRWLCPLAAVMNPLSRIGFLRVKRDEASCTSCGKCARVCPAAIPVDRMMEVTQARCIGCTDCVGVCPKLKEGALLWGPPRWMGGNWPRPALVAILLFCLGAAVAGAYLVPLPSFVTVRGEMPAQTATLHLRLEGLTCRGRANLLVGQLERDDMYQLKSSAAHKSAFMKVEAWPGPGWADAKVTFDASCVTERDIKDAITQSYYDLEKDRWYKSPFVIEGYQPVNVLSDEPAELSIP